MYQCNQSVQCLFIYPLQDAFDIVCTMHVRISSNERTKQSSIAVTVSHALVSTYHKTDTIYDSAPCTTEVQTDATQICYSATCPHTMPYIGAVWYTLPYIRVMCSCNVSLNKLHNLQRFCLLCHLHRGLPTLVKPANTKVL